MGLFLFKEKGCAMQLFLGHRLSAAHYRPIAATGHDEFSVAFGTEIPFSCLVGHLDQPRTQRGLSQAIIRRDDVGSQPDEPWVTVPGAPPCALCPEVKVG